MSDIAIRPERPEDVAAIHQVHAAVFPSVAEADLVDRLRNAGRAWVSLVAEVDGQIVGHVLFSPVEVHAPAGRWPGVGLAPVAVLPELQRRGIGSRLIEQGLAVCRWAGHSFAVVLGEPSYYRRFGFGRARSCLLENEYGVDEEFMVLELQVGGLPGQGGLVKYAPEFAELGG